MLTLPSIYKTYILRTWQTERDGQLVAFALLEDSRTGQRNVFTSLAALMAFLERGGWPELQGIKDNPTTS